MVISEENNGIQTTNQPTNQHNKHNIQKQKNYKRLRKKNEGGEPMSVYEYDETMENVHHHPDSEDEDEYMFDEYIDMMIDRARGQD